MPGKAQQLRPGRGFGGQVGIVWYNKRRRDAGAGTTTVRSPPPRLLGGGLVRPPPQPKNNLGKGKEDAAREGEEGNGRASDLSASGSAAAAPSVRLSWDDVLCRPVYHTTTSAPTTAAGCAVTSSEAEEEDDGDNNDDIKNNTRHSTGCDPPVDEAQHDERDNASAAPGVVVPRWIWAAKGLKGGGSGTAWSNNNNNNDDRFKKNRTCRTTKSRLRVLGFVPSRYGFTSGGSGDSIRAATQHEDDACQIRKAQTEPSRGVPTQPRTGGSADSVNDDLDFDEPDVRRHKPRKKQRTTLHSALSVAREYFRDLDSRHPLMLDHSASAASDEAGGCASRRGRVVDGRSVRPILASNPIVAREYESHHRACLEVGVSPLVWKHFLQQRRLYHATMYEGILDD
jgi:hypothetical protein